MYTSPEHDGRLLPWIDTTGKQIVTSTIETDGVWTHTFTPPEMTMQDVARLLNCLMHDDDTKCECCQDDPI